MWNCCFVNSSTIWHLCLSCVLCLCLVSVSCVCVLCLPRVLCLVSCVCVLCLVSCVCVLRLPRILYLAQRSTSLLMKSSHSSQIQIMEVMEVHMGVQLAGCFQIKRFVEITASGETIRRLRNPMFTGFQDALAGIGERFIKTDHPGNICTIRLFDLDRCRVDLIGVLGSEGWELKTSVAGNFHGHVISTYIPTYDIFCKRI